jgi:hypothetical protein
MMSLTKDAITNSVSNIVDLPKASRVREILDQEEKKGFNVALDLGPCFRASFSPDEEPDGHLLTRKVVSRPGLDRCKYHTYNQNLYDSRIVRKSIIIELMKVNRIEAL